MTAAQITPLVTLKEVAKVLAVSAMTVRRLVNSGELRCVRLYKGGRLRFDLADVQKFIALHKE